MLDGILISTIRAAPFGYWRLARMMRAARPSLGWHQTPTRYGKRESLDLPSLPALVERGM
jgi:hypothetical protein